jgi:hypothetical protein
MTGVPASRLRDIHRLYRILEELESADGRMDWSWRGVHFFFEPGEERITSGPGPRMVRVGTTP